MTGKEKFHRLVDELPEGEVLPAERFLEYLRKRASDPVLRAFIEAPLVDERLTEEDLRAIKTSEEELARRQVSTWEEVRTRLLKAS